MARAFSKSMVFWEWLVWVEITRSALGRRTDHSLHLAGYNRFEQ